MKTLAWTLELQNRLGNAAGPATAYGRPGPRRLSRWIYDLDLEKYNILVTEPIDCLNFITEIMAYFPDQETHGMAEHWLQDADQVVEWIFRKRRGDCDDAAVALASVLHSAGDDRIRLALGCYGNANPESLARGATNHAYCLLQEGEDRYLLLDPAGDQPVEELPEADPPLYHTAVSAAFDGRIWLHNEHAEHYRRLLHL